MILPNKHIDLENSLLGIGAIIIQSMPPNSPRTVSWLWENNKNQIDSFKTFSLSLSFLYMIGVIEFFNGTIHRSKIDL